MMSMSSFSPAIEPGTRVVYRAPIGQWICKPLLTLFVFGLIGGLAAWALWGAVGPKLWPTTAPPWWWHVVASAGVLLVALALNMLISRDMGCRLVLTEHKLRLSGLVFGRSYPYHMVRLIKLTKRERSSAAVNRIELKIGRWTRSKLLLRTKDAHECFDALRSLCPQAPAIGLDYRTYQPADEAYAKQGHETLAADFRGKSRRLLAGSIAGGLASIVMLAGLVFGGSAVRTHLRVWVMTFILPPISAGAYSTSRKCARTAREHETKAADVS